LETHPEPGRRPLPPPRNAAPHVCQHPAQPQRKAGGGRRACSFRSTPVGCPRGSSRASLNHPQPPRNLSQW